MKQIVGISLLLTPFFGFGQTWKFNQEAAEIMQGRDSTTKIETVEATEEYYDFLSRGTEDLETIYLGSLKDVSRNKPDELKKSVTLDQLAVLATKYWRGSHYSDSKKWKKLHKYFRRASDKVRAGFNIMEEFSFRIPLVNRAGERYYYDAKGEAGGLNLYRGKKPKTKQEREETEAVPLDFFTEEQLLEIFIKRIRRNRIYQDIKSGNVSCVGLSIEVDQNTLYKSKIPTARVVLIIGARRLKDIPSRYQNQNSNP